MQLAQPSFVSALKSGKGAMSGQLLPSPTLVGAGAPRGRFAVAFDVSAGPVRKSSAAGSRLEVGAAAAAATTSRVAQARGRPDRRLGDLRPGGCATSTPSARRSPIGGDGERQVARVDGPVAPRARSPRSPPRSAPSARAAAREDDRARHRRVPLDDRRAPAQRRLGLVGQEQRQRPVDGRVGRLGAGQVRRCGTHGVHRYGDSSRVSERPSLGRRPRPPPHVPSRDRSMNSLIACAVAVTSGTTLG